MGVWGLDGVLDVRVGLIVIELGGSVSRWTFVGVVSGKHKASNRVTTFYSIRAAGTSEASSSCGSEERDTIECRKGNGTWMRQQG